MRSKIIFLPAFLSAVSACSAVKSSDDLAVSYARDVVPFLDEHCIACHDKQVHWRDARLATDWKSLAAQVRRWRTNTGLQWSEQEVDEVVRYLNETIYKFPDEAPRQVG